MAGVWHKHATAAVYTFCLHGLTSSCQRISDTQIAGVQMQAEINLLVRALQDPLAQRFVMLSESCIPMFPAEAAWLQILAQPRSRVNACLDWHNQDAVDQAMTYRCPCQHSPNPKPFVMLSELYVLCSQRRRPGCRSSHSLAAG